MVLLVQPDQQVPKVISVLLGLKVILDHKDPKVSLALKDLRERRAQRDLKAK